MRNRVFSIFLLFLFLTSLFSVSNIMSEGGHIAAASHSNASVAESSQTENISMVYLDPPIISEQIGMYINVSVMAVNVQFLWAWEASVTWDSNILQYISDTPGEFLELAGTGLGGGLTKDNQTFHMLQSTVGGGVGKSVSTPNMTLYTITFTIVNAGSCELGLENVRFKGRDPFNVTAYPRWSDTDGNGIVDLFDLVHVTKGALELPLHGDYNQTDLDLNNDGVVDVTDVAIVTSDFAKNDTDPLWGVTNVIFDIPVVIVSPPPFASFWSSPLEPCVNELIAFNASNSYSRKSNITSYEWNFGDNVTNTTMEPATSHTYAMEGNYIVTLNVTDSQGLWNMTSSVVTVTYGTDINRDRAVNILDITIVAAAYNTRPSDEKWNALADLDKNEWINILDISAVAKDFGKTV